jgi:hypothetical protein
MLLDKHNKNLKIFSIVCLFISVCLILRFGANKVQSLLILKHSNEYRNEVYHMFNNYDSFVTDSNTLEFYLSDSNDKFIVDGIEFNNISEFKASKQLNNNYYRIKNLKNVDENFFAIENVNNENSNELMSLNELRMNLNKLKISLNIIYGFIAIITIMVSCRWL